MAAAGLPWSLCPKRQSIVTTSVMETRQLRLHWATFVTAIAMLLPGIYCQMNGKVYRDREGPYYGWPFVHPGNDYRFLSNAFPLDLLCMMLVAVSTGFVAERVVRWVRRNAQFKLVSMLLWVAVVAAVLALFRFQALEIYVPSADFVDRNVLFDPIAIRYPPLVTLTILIGLGCTLYSLFWLAGRGVACVSRRRDSAAFQRGSLLTSTPEA